MKPVIQLVNHSTFKGPEFAGITKPFVSALNSFASLIEAVWGAGALVTDDLSIPDPKHCWRMVFLDDADQADALGYHEFYRGKPLSKVFVKTCVADKSSVSVCSSHELAEMLCDPSAAQTVQGAYKGKPANYAKEVCDAVEETDFGIFGFRMSNFVTPHWFENIAHPPGTLFDHLGLVKKPFQMLKGGYCPIQINGHWTQIFGDKAKESRFLSEDRRGHRNESLRH